MTDDFACGCTDESREKAEGWLREALPGLPKGEEKVLTGRKKHYRYEGTDGKVYEGEYDEHREMQTVETLLVSFDELSQARGGWFRFGIATDQWCGLSIEWVKGDEVVRRVSVQYDYGMLSHALARALLIFKKELVTS